MEQIAKAKSAGYDHVAGDPDPGKTASILEAYLRSHPDVAALKAAGCDVIRSEKVSGTSTKGRAELRTVLDFLRKGDTLTVTRIDRLARSIADLAAIVRELESKGVALKATEQPIDTSSSAGKAFLGMWACSPSSRPTSAANASLRA